MDTYRADVASEAKAVTDARRSMSARKRLIVGACLLAAIGLGVVPPWERRLAFVGGGEMRVASGHALIFDPPESEPVGRIAWTYHVDIARLSIYWAIVAFAGTFALVLFDRRVPGRG
jgi:hypothetical protein